MNLSEIFDKLLEQRKIALCLSPIAADSLRVSLIRKFKDYQEQTAKLGWLTEEFEKAVVSLEYNKEDSVATYFLRPRRRVAITYTLLEIPDDSSQANS